MLTKAESKFYADMRAIFKVKKRLRPSQWLAETIRLPPGKNETKPGKIDWSYTPYLPEVIDQVEVPGVVDVYLAAPTRSGKTFVLRGLFAYSIAADPAPVLLIDSTMDKGRGLAKKELLPLVEYNRVLRDRKPSNHHDMSLALMLFPGANFTIFGANSDAQISGETVKRVLGNEIDKWRQSTEAEASILEQARHRTESFEGERRHFFSSTPTLTTGAIWTGIMAGDYRKWYVPCPFCGHFQTLEWDRVHIDAAAKRDDGTWDLQKVKETAHFRCEKCPNPWSDKDRRKAITDPRAHWRATQQGKPGVVSFHINGLYGPLKSNNMGELMVDFLTSRRSGFFIDRQDFWNGRMGMPWMDDVRELKWNELDKWTGLHERGDLPAGFKPDVLIIGADAQTWGYPWVIHAYAWSGEHYLIDHGTAATLDDLAEIQTEYAKYGMVWGILDIRFEGKRAIVLEFLHKMRSRRWLGAEGHELMKDLVKVEAGNAFMGGEKQKLALTFYKLLISEYEFKLEVEKRFSGEIPNWRVYKLAVDATPSDKRERKELLEELVDEYRAPRKKAMVGKPAFEWRSRTGKNHGFDCTLYAMALFFALSKKRAYAKRGKKARQLAIVKP